MTYNEEDTKLINYARECFESAKSPLSPNALRTVGIDIDKSGYERKLMHFFDLMTSVCDLKNED